MEWTCLTLASAIIWFGILLLPWRPWSIREVLDSESSSANEDLGDITVLIPARDEAASIAVALSAIKAQGRNISLILVDDQSMDGTSRIASQAAGENLRVIPAEPLPAGWTGKLWALEQGTRHVYTALTLLLDADIELRPGILALLRKKMVEGNLQFVSLMADLHMVGFWERLLLPAFVYFFRLLYPFHLANSPSSRVAAAAGGCILMETRLIDEMGGFRALRGELIDDCALAKRVKSLGYKTWIGLTHSARSLRPYNRLGALWDMVARTAYAQLAYSPLLLLLCTFVMIIAFGLPTFGLFFLQGSARIISAASLGAMMLGYLPTLRFYGVSGGFAVAMPAIGALFLAMTWTSAFRFWKNRGGQWKGRSYGKKEGP